MEILLHKNELLDLGKNLSGCRILCQSGCCWLTQTGDSRDHILRAGDSFNVGLRGQLLITATADSRLMLVAESAASKASSPWQPLTCGN